MTPSWSSAQWVADVVTERLGRPVVADGWRPSVQGAVGHLLGMREPDGPAYAAKVFPADDESRAETETVALRLAASTGVPVAAVVLIDVLPNERTTFVLMERLPGVRWSDRRAKLAEDQLADLHGRVAGLMRQLHTLTGPAFGSLLDSGARWRTGWQQVMASAEQAAEDYQRSGGPADLVVAAHRALRSRKDAFDGLVPALCHTDVNGGNVLVTPDGSPLVTGLVDFERACWGDPMRDLALTSLHVRYHHPHAVPELLDAYGIAEEHDRERLELHVVLLAMAERAWIVTDRPMGWRDSAARLDRLLQSSLRP